MRTILSAVLFLLILAAFAVVFHWTVNRVYVRPGQSLQLRYKGPFLYTAKKAEQGQWAKENEIGVREMLRGPGRHFYCPLWWERKIVDDILIQPGQVGIVTCKLGDSLPSGQYLVDGEIGETNFKGILRKALAPGRYRINPYGYQAKIVGTENTASTTGVQNNILRFAVLSDEFGKNPKAFSEPWITRIFPIKFNCNS